MVILQNIFFRVIDILFPSFCIYCNTVISNKDACLCGSCVEKVRFLGNKCERCSGELIDNQCRMCADREIFFDKNYCIAEYSGLIKEILHNYKFNRRKRLYKHLSFFALKEISGLKDNFDIITWVPLNRKKRWERGFNQSELIAADIARKLKKDILPLLKEKYHFKTQNKLGYRDRFLNILDRYAVRNTVKNKEYLPGKNVLIVDDVFTTGATINECARILKSFGVEKVYSLTIARADIKRLDKF